MDSQVIFLLTITAQIWAWASNTGGYDVEAMVKATKGTSSLNPETRDKTIQYLVAQMDRLLGYRRPHSNKVDRIVSVVDFVFINFHTAKKCSYLAAHPYTTKLFFTSATIFFQQFHV